MRKSGKGADYYAQFFEANDSDIECKLAIMINNDLKMGKGKAATQFPHASVIAYDQTEEDFGQN